MTRGRDGGHVHRVLFQNLTLFAPCSSRIPVATLLLFVFFALCVRSPLVGALEAEDSAKDATLLLEKIRAQPSLKAVRELSILVESLPASLEKGQILAYRASLEFLSGNHERSARLWLDAHSCTADDAFLLDAVRALILIGENDAARAQLDRLVSRGRDPHSLREARFLLSQLALLEGRLEDAVLPQDLAPSLPHRMASWHFIGLICGTAAADPLVRDHAGSPEQYLLAGNPRVSLFPHPLWYMRPPQN